MPSIAVREGGLGPVKAKTKPKRRCGYGSPFVPCVRYDDMSNAYIASEGKPKDVALSAVDAGNGEVWWR